MIDDTRSVAGKELCGVERHRSWMRSVIAARSAAKFRVMIALGCCDAGVAEEPNAGGPSR